MSVRFRAVAIAASSLSVMLSQPAEAAQVVINQTLDLTKAQLAPTYMTADFTDAQAAFSPIAKFNLSVGDSLTWAVDFAGDQALDVVGLHMPVAIFLTDGFGSPATVSMTGTLSFFAPDGSQIYALTQTDTNAALHVGQFFYGDIAPRPSFTFSGFRYTGVVDAYGAYLGSPAPLTRTYELPYFSVSGTSVRLVSAPLDVGLVPEPATWSLLLLGFGAAGAMLRLRARAPVPTV